ncbi:ribbon-helix-helix domain-containing protein [Rhizobium sp. BK376]|jgi:antitoxin ParD1/3/4|uniref:ribbon-helix-helix domain-containing protein n=1 Tax=Rhizobium sp. BK376 TaxID=2512149 RepID=UPI0010535EA9|nr:ribbon-helix-helix domain-containing protein [Rhizobium sp. BK376]TCR91315.1 antitoxin ParD1/3/4 [Rhizobium sp. BK376]
MNVKTTVSLSESTLRDAEELVRKGEYASLSDVLEEAARRLISERHDAVDPLTGMADEIRRRMELPRDQFLPWDGPAMAERIKARLREKHDK